MPTFDAPRHALIIDDNPLNIDVLRIMLDRVNVTSITVGSLREASKLIEQINPPDVVFLDLEFPTGDGFAFLETLKTTPQLVGVPVVAYSVHTSEIDRARRMGFDSFLGKPLNAQRFPDQLRDILNGISVWEA
jgi:two-component system cell cycle response regulator DivK